MIKNFRGNRTPDTSLTWDERYPESYVYKRSEAIANIMRKIELRHSLLKEQPG